MVSTRQKHRADWAGKTQAQKVRAVATAMGATVERPEDWEYMILCSLFDGIEEAFRRLLRGKTYRILSSRHGRCAVLVRRS